MRTRLLHPFWNCFHLHSLWNSKKLLQCGQAPEFSSFNRNEMFYHLFMYAFKDKNGRMKSDCMSFKWNWRNTTQQSHLNNVLFFHRALSNRSRAYVCVCFYIQDKSIACTQLCAFYHLHCYKNQFRQKMHTTGIEYRIKCGPMYSVQWIIFLSLVECKPRDLSRSIIPHA